MTKTLTEKYISEIEEALEELNLKIWETHKVAYEEDAPIANYISPIASNNGFGSTDIGDVQHIAPGVMFSTATHNIAAPGHSWQITASAGSSCGQKGMIYESKVMANATNKAIKNSDIIKKAKAEFDEVMKNKEYNCPVPDEVPIPNKK